MIRNFSRASHDTYREYTFDYKIMVLLKGVLVTFRERSGELLFLVCLRCLERLAGEGEPTQQPH